MPPPLSLSSLARSRSLNRPRGRPSSVISQTPTESTFWSHFQYFNGQESELPCPKRALIVAIEYLDGQSFPDERPMHLPGCHADANDIRELLMEKGGYNQKDIRILADVPGLPDSQRPTRDNITESMNWLSMGCRAGDYRFFHYAGHGTQAEDQDGDEEDGLDEGDHEDKGLIIDDEFRDLLVDPLPANSTLTAVIDCCHSGTILDMEQETKAQARSGSRPPVARGSTSSLPSRIPSIILKLKWPRCREGVSYPVGNILELPELAKVKDSEEPVSPGAERGPITASEFAVLEKKNVESPSKRRVYVPIVANVVCWSACLDNQLAWSRPPGDEDLEPGRITYDRGVLTAGFTTGLRGAAANYNGMPGGFNTEHRNATYAELFDYILAQERQAYEERQNYSIEMARLYQDPQLWISASMGDIMDRPVVI
ncbi:ICE-like protease (caspase) p20 domain protein [Ceratobasidium sp. AG-Ba]|nr:ICE-like protease (caspase) p20 domain protein [Ceratobasidium sp. AG-Ba]